MEDAKHLVMVEPQVQALATLDHLFIDRSQENRKKPFHLFTIPPNQDRRGASSISFTKSL